MGRAPRARAGCPGSTRRQRLPRLIDLDEPACVDVRLTGAKAAALARARARGLPVLPGVVVPLDASEAFFRRALEGLAAGGSGAARLAALESGLDPGLAEALAARAGALGEPLIVRSSSPLEGHGHWAGAFSTFHDVAADELPTAVRGCWSSAFSVDALERAEAAGLDAEQLRLAVLVQPQLACRAGGVARVQPDGGVEVVAVSGPPAPLLAGWEPGVRARVTPDGDVEGETAIAALGRSTLAAAATLALEVWTATGFGAIEWADAEGQVNLLQLQRSSRPAAGQPSPAPHPALGQPVALRVARAAQRWAGPLGEEFVLPWALALAAPPAGTTWLVGDPGARGAPEAGTDPLADWRAARDLSAELCRRLWPSPGEARAVLRELRGAAPERVLPRVEALPDLDPAEGARVLARFGAVGVALAARGALRSADELWRCTPGDVESALGQGVALARGQAPTVRLHQAAVTHWEPFVHAVVRMQGASLEGTPVAAGIGAGALSPVANPHADRVYGIRPVLVAPRPLPGLAPLLWNAAGLVIGSGNRAAHLLEVATSVGVPTVVGIDVERLVHAAGGPAEAADALVAVDGNTGAVAVVAGAPQTTV